jgi:hypothetical protein
MDRSAGRFQVSERSSLARAAHIIGLSHLTLVLVCVAWRFALFMPQRLVRLLLFHYHRRSTSCLFCGRSHLPKGHSKGPDAVGGAKAIRSVLFFISASLDLPSPLSVRPVVLPSAPALVIPLPQGLDREHPPRPAPASLAF